MSRSLQVRLAWRLAVVFAATILVTSLAILLHRGDSEIPRAELMEAIDRITAGLSRDSSGGPRLALPGHPDFDYAVATSDGRTLFASAAPPPPAPAGWSAGFLRPSDRTMAYRNGDSRLGKVGSRLGPGIHRPPRVVRGLTQSPGRG